MFEQFLGRIDTHREDSRKRESFAMCECGIVRDGESMLHVCASRQRSRAKFRSQFRFING